MSQREKERQIERESERERASREVHKEEGGQEGAKDRFEQARETERILGIITGLADLTSWPNAKVGKTNLIPYQARKPSPNTTFLPHERKHLRTSYHWEYQTKSFAKHSD